MTRLQAIKWWLGRDIILLPLLMLCSWLAWHGLVMATEWRDARWLAERKVFYERCVERGGKITETRYDYSCVGLPTPKL